MKTVKYMKNKIVFCLSILGGTRAGVAVFAKNLFDALDNRKNSAISVVPFFNPFSTIDKKGVTRKILSLLSCLFTETIIWQGRRTDFYFFPTFLGPFSLLFFQRAFGVVICDLFAWKNSDKTTFFGAMQMKFLALFARRANIVFTISEFSKHDISKTFSIPDEKIVIVKIGLDRQFLREDQCMEALPELCRNQEYILNVGSLEPRKNIVFLIDVFEAVQKRRLSSGKRPVKLVLTGGESWRCGDVIDRIRSCEFSDDIIRLGYVENFALPALYRNAKVMVFPSLAEGFGIPVIESLSQGTPVMINNNTSLSEFKDYGVTMIDDFNLQTWVGELDKIISKGERVRSEFVDKVRSDFDWAKSSVEVTEKIVCYMNKLLVSSER